jgi:exonuclease SbcD
MPKFVITGDLHFRGINPRARLDNFKEAITKKLYEVYDIARQHEASAIIIPGDVFDGPSPGWGTVAELGMVLKLAPCPVLAIAGNHDIWGGNPGSKPRTPFGMLSKLGLIWDLTEEPYEVQDIAITGHSFTVETDTDLGRGQFVPPPHVEEWSGTAIHVVHSMLMDHSPGFEMRHTLISRVETSANVIISGHEHLGFGIHRREDGVLFINPGALCRLSAHHAEIERQVQVALLTAEGGRVDAELIPLRSAAPGHEVLSRAHLEAQAEREERMQKFLGLLAEEGETKFLEVREIIEDICRRESLPQEIKGEALSRLAKAKEELGVRTRAG